MSDGNGISFPNFEKVAAAFDIAYKKIDTLDDIERSLFDVYTTGGPVLCEVAVDEKQNFEPKLSSKVLPDGRIVSPELDDMYPFLPKEEIENIHREAAEI